jgi:hypothetical protein
MLRKAGENFTLRGCVFYILHELLVERSRQRSCSVYRACSTHGSDVTLVQDFTRKHDGRQLEKLRYGRKYNIKMNIIG